MNKLKNIEIIHAAGDQIQLQYGQEFGYFAKKITNEQLIEFCHIVNRDNLVSKLGYNITLTRTETGKTILYARNFKQNFHFPIKLFDRSIYFTTDDATWAKIDESFFSAVQKQWFKFLENNLEECRSHMFMCNV